ncbi:hypothetical protein S7711_10680 [Stachybotrys chartarum IBT 7711]|uniref:Uncharacterized protein n=1 Tax=Stachybotrys chartarum (strain CBS 109288 / IBT 7711) TaxID=1280523 RepID=A0A084AWQ0_STACB|nr:hypothetical protein S7711_10680 [Stachybotrys chartarum IBT 7711]KFA49378.1 hypothetical protein S40293_10786 [Stachybotrys chartarum IBT 40293]KFA80523.1 hypothetical protein S40288_10685 [Stachybotrys chartarum IBT 40288]
MDGVWNTGQVGESLSRNDREPSLLRSGESHQHQDVQACGLPVDRTGERPPHAATHGWQNVGPRREEEESDSRRGSWWHALLPCDAARTGTLPEAYGICQRPVTAAPVPGGGEDMGYMPPAVGFVCVDATPASSAWAKWPCSKATHEVGVHAASVTGDESLLPVHA